MEGIVSRSTGSWYSIRTAQNDIIECKLKGNYKLKGIKTTNPIAVGDHVRFILMQEKGIGLIEHIYERKNYIIRQSTNLSKRAHIIASNIDQAFLVVTISDPRTSTGFIDRFLVTSEAFSIPCTIVINKIDLIDQDTVDLLNEIKDIYSNIGYAIIETSATKQINLELLKDAMKDKTCVFSGHSGVGKSALINAIAPEFSLREGETSDVHHKGKHTTTHAEMHFLQFGSRIIDTPGIKEFGLSEFEASEIGHFFPEIKDLMNECKFNNCTHEHEPGCAVKKAVDVGAISSERYKNYLNIINGEELQTQTYE